MAILYKLKTKQDVRCTPLQQGQTTKQLKHPSTRSRRFLVLESYRPRSTRQCPCSGTSPRCRPSRRGHDSTYCKVTFVRRRDGHPSNLAGLELFRKIFNLLVSPRALRLVGFLLFDRGSQLSTLELPHDLVDLLDIDGIKVEASFDGSYPLQSQAIDIAYRLRQFVAHPSRRDDQTWKGTKENPGHFHILKRSSQAKRSPKDPSISLASLLRCEV